MTDLDPNRTSLNGSDDEIEGLVRPEDLASASRSCSAIIVVILFILLLVCVFLVGTLFFR
jgi:hypothetical protein